MNMIPALTFAIMALVCIFCFILPDDKEFETPEEREEYDEATKIKILDEVQTCEFTGKKYYATRMVKCTCICHTDDNYVHEQPCCYDEGLIEERIYV